jgi:hypothetical protein
VAKESTAIANLLEMAARRPIERQPDDDLLFAMPKSVEAPKAKKRPRSEAAPAVAMRPRSEAAPAVAKRPRSEAAPAIAMRPRSVPAVAPAPIELPPVSIAPTPAPDTHQLTHRIPRARDYRKPVLAGAMIAGGLAVGLALWKVAGGGGGAAAVAAAALPAPAAVPAPAPAPAPAALPAPAPAPQKMVVQPLPPTAPPPRPALVDIALESKPIGATVTLVDRGASQIAGTTPLALSIDPTREYDLQFALDGQEPKTVHLDPHTMKRLTVELAVVEPDPLPLPAAKPAVQARAAAPHRTAAASTGSGTLMVSTKPPCEIAIDGKPTGMITPQRAIAVAAGHHQVTFTNKQQHIKKTVTVDVNANQATKLIRDLMK